MVFWFGRRARGRKRLTPLPGVGSFMVFWFGRQPQDQCLAPRNKVSVRSWCFGLGGSHLAILRPCPAAVSVRSWCFGLGGSALVLDDKREFKVSVRSWCFGLGGDVQSLVADVWTHGCRFVHGVLVWAAQSATG